MPGCGHGDVGRRAAEVLAEGLDVPEREAALQRVDVHPDPAHRDELGDEPADEPCGRLGHRRSASQVWFVPLVGDDGVPRLGGDGGAVLLDDVPAGVAVGLELGQEGLERDVAPAERAGHLSPPRLEMDVAAGLGGGDDGVAHVLDVDVVHAVGVLLRVGRGRGAAEFEVAAVEAERDVGQLHEPVDLGGLLDVGGVVGVEDGGARRTT
ncbi:hypothetical protein GCM10020219_041540 [Nonomuraea dietziae]